MDQIINNYLKKMASFSTVILEKIESVNKYWSPEEPPVIVLFSQIGKTLARIYPSFENAQKESVFQHIEEGMTSTNDELATAVATGLIEAIVTSTDGDHLLWAKIEKSLGHKSKEHALAWKNFGQ